VTGSSDSQTRARSGDRSEPVVVVLLEELPAAFVERALHQTHGFLAAIGLSLSGPWPMSVPLPALPDERGITLIRALAALRPARPVLALTSRTLRNAHNEPLGGEAQVGGRIAVVSTAGQGDDPPGMARRVAHEVGHLQGLRHCAAGGCVMGANTPEPPGEGSPVGFCERCQAHLRMAAEGGCPGQASEAG
jgi:hypothetical protein